MTTRIAVGVFIGVGVLAGYFIIHALRSKTDQSQAERATRLGIATQQLTPEYVIAHCGKPAEDKIEGSVRQMQYPPFVTFQFAKLDNGWAPGVAREFPGLGTISNEALAGELPCLALPK